MSNLSVEKSAVTPFLFEHQEVRVVMIDDQPWFVAKDVALALGYVDLTSAIRQHCKGVAKHHPLMTGGGTQNLRVIAEGDVMRLIVSSRLPAAVDFERRVFDEILPSIRRTGTYGHSATLTDEEIVAQALAITSAKVKQLEAKVTEDAPKVEYVEQYVAPDDDVIQFRIAAQQLGIGEVELRKILTAAKWAYRANIGRRWSQSEERMVDVFEWRPYAKHADKFQLRPQHNAPRHHNGQLRQTLYIKAFALPKLADLISYGDGDEQLIDKVQ